MSFLFGIFPCPKDEMRVSGRLLQQCCCGTLRKQWGQRLTGCHGMGSGGRSISCARLLAAPQATIARTLRAEQTGPPDFMSLSRLFSTRRDRSYFHYSFRCDLFHFKYLTAGANDTLSLAPEATLKTNHSTGAVVLFGQKTRSTVAVNG